MDNTLLSEGTSALVNTLNDLLSALHLRLTLESPTDLTPSLLVALLECLLRARLDIPPSVRASRDFPARVQATKVFLGVLERDVLRRDVGLGDVDPRRLARGERAEAVFVGERLCWAGKEMGLLPSGSSAASDVFGDVSANAAPGASPPRFVPPAARADRTRRSTASPPSPTPSTATNTAHSYLSLGRAPPADTDTSVASLASEAPPLPLPLPDPFPPPQVPAAVQTGAHSSRGSDESGSASSRSRPRRRPRCIHEVEEPSLLDGPEGPAGSPPSSSPDISASESYCDCAPSLQSSARFAPAATSRAVRLTGYIDQVDEASELRSFEAGRSPGAQRRPRPGASGATPRRRTSGGASGLLTRHNSPQYTLALMHERARLLSELAALEAGPSSR